MSLTSMTGFADMQGECCGQHWRWEVKSVNGRGLDLRWRLPPGFEKLEAEGRVLAGNIFKRGNLQISLTLEKDATAPALHIDKNALETVIAIAKEAERASGLPAARIDGLLALKGVLVSSDSDLSEDEHGTLSGELLEGLTKLFASLNEARATEGAKLTRLMSDHVDKIDTLTKQATDLAASQPATIRERLAAQIAELVAPGTVNEERLAQEVAMMAVRADVREELDRLRAHIAEARRLIKAGAAVGRKLDFLAQEFNRETNTLCSKSADVELTRVGLDLKAVIDQFREQAANVE